MPAYRFYPLPRSGDDHPNELMFFNDAAAMTWGLRRAGAGGVEIWETGRFVGRLHARAETAPLDSEQAELV